MANLVDTIIIFRILRKLTTPWEKTAAFKTGLIDKNGKVVGQLWRCLRWQWWQQRRGRSILVVRHYKWPCIYYYPLHFNISYISGKT